MDSHDVEALLLGLKKDDTFLGALTPPGTSSPVISSQMSMPNALPQQQQQQPSSIQAAAVSTQMLVTTNTGSGGLLQVRQQPVAVGVDGQQQMLGVRQVRAPGQQQMGVQRMIIHQGPQQQQQQVIVQHVGDAGHPQGVGQHVVMTPGGRVQQVQLVHQQQQYQGQAGQMQQQQHGQIVPGAYVASEYVSR
jgi:hypothetical protein